MKSCLLGAVSTLLLLMALASTVNAALVPRLGGAAVYDLDFDIASIPSLRKRTF